MNWIDKNLKPPNKYDSDSNEMVLVWHKYQQTLPMKWDKAIENGHVDYWQPCPIAPDDSIGWINKTEKMPRDSDYDCLGCVLAWVYERVAVAGKKALMEDINIIWWRPCPKAPRTAK